MLFRDSNEYPQHMFLWRTDKNYPSIIIRYLPYLFFFLFCKNLIGQAGDKANTVKASGESAADDAREALVGVQEIIDSLPEQLAKTKPIVNDVVATNRDINVVSTQGKELYFRIVNTWCLNICRRTEKQDLSDTSNMLKKHLVVHQILLLAVILKYVSKQLSILYLSSLLG